MARPEVDRYRLEHYTGVQASIWVRDIWIDEIFGIAFTATSNVIPLWGYASRFYNAVATGKTLIQGSFEINFVDEGYLYYILHKANAEKTVGTEKLNTSQQKITGELPPPKTELGQSYSDYIQAADGLVGGLTDAEIADFAVSEVKLLNDLSNTALALGPDETTRAMGDIIEVVEGLSYEEMSRGLKEIDNIKKSQTNTSFTNPRNIIYESVPFNIMGLFGNPEQSRDNITQKVLKNCYLISNEMVIAQNDEVIQERYSFIAQIHQ